MTEIVMCFVVQFKTRTSLTAPWPEKWLTLEDYRTLAAARRAVTRNGARNNGRGPNVLSKYRIVRVTQEEVE